MKEKSIRFSSLSDNSKQPKADAAKEPILMGYISTSGKLVFHLKTVEQLPIDFRTTSFKVGVQTGKRKLNSLYLIPTQEQEDVFTFTKAAKSYTIALGVILQKGCVQYSQTKYTFKLVPFNYEAGIKGYELQLEDSAPTAAYTGKPRGRKTKTQMQDA